MTDVSIEVTRTRADFFNGIWANTLRTPATLLWYAFGSSTVSVIAVVVNSDRTISEQAIIGATKFLAMVTLYALILWFCVVLAVRKVCEGPGALGPVTYRFSQEGLGVTASTGHGLSHWNTWKSAFEIRSLFVVRHHLNLIHILPKRQMPVETQLRLRVMLRSVLSGRVAFKPEPLQ